MIHSPSGKRSAAPPHLSAWIVRILPLALTTCSALAVYCDANSATLRVGSGKTYATVRAAAQAAHNGDVVEIDAGLYANDVASWTPNNLTVRGVGGRAQLIVTNGTNQAGKGIWVVSGANFTAENIEFAGAAVPDKNAAGIRADGSGTLTIRNCYFHDNQDGILGADNNSAVLIEYSIFDHNGFGDGLSHNMYIGTAQSFTLQYSYTHRAVTGHDVKTRAATNFILYNRILDEDGTASYNVDVPDGGRTLLIGNVIEQGPSTDNSAIVVYAAENPKKATLELYAVNNTIVNGRTSGGQFFSLRTGTNAVIKNNILYGAGTPWSGGSVTASNNYIHASYDNAPGFSNPSSYDYRLSFSSPSGTSGIVDAGGAPGSSSVGQDLTPVSEYVSDAQKVARIAVGTIDIGAFELSNPGTGFRPLPPENLKVLP